VADIKEIMRRQYGPMPVWAWTTLAASVIAGLIIFNKRKAGTTVPAGSGSGQNVDTSGDGFQSGISTTTTDAAGNQVTTNYSAQGPNSFLPGQVFQAGGMPYTSGGDVYVNYPNGGGTPPPQATTNNLRQPLDVKDFNAQTAGNSPWYMTVANPGETWQDISARVYGFGANYASITDPKVKAQVDAVVPYIQNRNNMPGSTGNGPAPGSVVFFH
jgi:hypothetical protein